VNKIESALVQFFKHTPEKTIIIAYSGGVDSQVLLVALAKLKQQELLPNPLVVLMLMSGKYLRSNNVIAFHCHYSPINYI
jgi:tRNA(Ile)-lysidine synthase